MKRRGIAISLTLAVVAGRAVATHSTRANASVIPKITVLRTPRGGLQPQTMLDPDGVLHMVHLKGDPSAGDIEWVSRRTSEEDFCTARCVTRQPRGPGRVGTLPRSTVAGG